MSPVPTLETPRLILRETRLADFEAYSAMWREPEVLRFTQRVAPAPEMMWMRFLRNVGFWHHLGYGLLTVEEKASGRFVGQVGFFDARREMEPSIEARPEAGWTLIADFQGRGYGLEAVGALMAWGGAALAGQRAVAIIDIDNHASQSLAKRVGFSLVDRTVYRGDPVLLFERSL